MNKLPNNSANNNENWCKLKYCSSQLYCSKYTVSLTQIQSVQCVLYVTVTKKFYIFVSC